MSAAERVECPALAAALSYARLGWHVLPLHGVRDGRCTCGKPDCGKSTGKHPRILTGAEHAGAATTDEDTICGWWGRWPDCNVGIMTGPASGVVVLDVDGERGLETLQRLEVELGPLPRTATSRTGSGGYHYLFQHPGHKVVNRAHALGACLDIRGNGGLFVLPPSMHYSGRQYEWLALPETVGLAPYDWLERAHALVEERKAAERAARETAIGAPPAGNVVPLRTQDRATVLLRASAYLGKMAPSISGQGGHAALWEAALAMVRGFQLDPGDALGLLAREFNARCVPPWSERELRHKVAQAQEQGERPWGYLLNVEREAPRKQQAKRTEATRADTRKNGKPDDMPGPPDGPDGLPDPWNRTDMGNAERLVARHGGELRHCSALGWLVWDGTRWAKDESGEVQRRAKETVRAIYEEAATAYSDDERKAIARWAIQSEARSRVDNMIAMAASDGAVSVAASVFDSDPWLLNVSNGTIDLRTGKMREHDPADLLTKLAPVEFDAETSSQEQAPLWREFLGEVLPETEIRNFMQRLIGYSITGVIRDHVLPINYGSGRNGKGVFTNSLLHALGTYSDAVPTELLMEKRGETHPSERATLWGLRLACASETEEGRAFNVALVKQLTGGDLIKTRYMRQDWFSFWPTHKLMLSTNNRPVIRETKNAIWERVLLIPWTVVIPPERRDPELGEKLKKEAAGILKWAVEGCLLWQKEGLAPPESIRAATEEYRVAQDKTGGFFDECCVFAEGCKVSSADLLKEYERWCERNSERQVSNNTFSERVIERGGKAGRFYVTDGVRNKQVRGWLGVGLCSQQQQEDARW